MSRRSDSERGEGTGSSPLTSSSLLERVKTQGRRAWQRLVDVYADNGVYTVTVTVTDYGGLGHSDELTVTIMNVAPTVEAVNQTVNDSCSKARTAVQVVARVGIGLNQQPRKKRQGERGAPRRGLPVPASPAANVGVFPHPNPTRKRGRSAHE